MIIFTISKEKLFDLGEKLKQLIKPEYLIFLSLFLSIEATIFSYTHNLILSYGDAESHIDIAKRVVDSLTPGFAQLGGIWLPLPHLLMIPFVKFDFLWRTGLAGSIVAGVCFIIGSIYIYKLTFLITKNRIASLVSFLVFVLNPNILYLQTTPLTEIPLITFIILSSYYFVKFLTLDSVLSLVMAAFFGFCASLSRYDGWFLVAIEAFVIILRYINIRSERQKLQGLLVLFSTLSFIGILFWLGWDFLILGNPFYFISSPYSANTQQHSWLARGQLPAYRNPFMSFLYYFVDSMSLVGILLFGLAIVGLIAYILEYKKSHTFLIALILLSPFIFNVLSLFVGESVIFIPHLTPITFDWRLFNTRYGAIMVPAAAFFIGFLFYRVKTSGKLLILSLFLIQIILYGIGYSQALAMSDGISGLSTAKKVDAEVWLNSNYDNGLVLIDDYARSVSIIRSGIPMQNIIYVGNKPYWQESLQEPEKYAKWIVIQKDDTVWNNLYQIPEAQGKLYKYFTKVYTSPNILIFKKTDG